MFLQKITFNANNDGMHNEWQKIISNKMLTFNIFVQLFTANYCVFCCFNEDIKKKGKSVVYIRTFFAQLLSAELFIVWNIHPT